MLQSLSLMRTMRSAPSWTPQEMSADQSTVGSKRS